VCVTDIEHVDRHVVITSNIILIIEIYKYIIMKILYSLFHIDEEISRFDGETSQENFYKISMKFIYYNSYITYIHVYQHKHT